MRWSHKLNHNNFLFQISQSNFLSDKIHKNHSFFVYFNYIHSSFSFSNSCYLERKRKKIATIGKKGKESRQVREREFVFGWILFWHLSHVARFALVDARQTRLARTWARKSTGRDRGRRMTGTTRISRTPRVPASRRLRARGHPRTIPTTQSPRTITRRLSISTATSRLRVSPAAETATGNALWLPTLYNHRHFFSSLALQTTTRCDFRAIRGEGGKVVLVRKLGCNILRKLIK